MTEGLQPAASDVDRQQRHRIGDAPFPDTP
jgi:hypothetical protein